MSRTHHRQRADKGQSRRRSSRPALTKGEAAGWYPRSVFDKPANRGKPGAWMRWLSDYNGYHKDRKRRKQRAFMKRHGRRKILRHPPLSALVGMTSKETA